MSDTNTIETIMTELKLRRDWNNPEEVEIWFEARLREVEAEVRAEERARVRGEIEQTRNKLAEKVMTVTNEGMERYLLGKIDVLDDLLDSLDKTLQVDKE